MTLQGSHRSLNRSDYFTRVREAHDPKETLEFFQQTLKEIAFTGDDVFDRAFENFVRRELWRQLSDRNGKPFESFGHFAVEKEPMGLDALRTETRVAWLRGVLRKNFVREWTAFLRLVQRDVGRPPKNLAGGEDFKCSYRISTSSNSVDRILLRLEREAPKAFDDVCSGKRTPQDAARTVGILPAGKTVSHFGVFDERGLLRGEVLNALSDHQKIALISQLQNALERGLS